MLTYILQVVLFQLFFLTVYEAFLKKETFFNWNRFYLIFTSILSYVIPFLRVKYFEKYVPEQFTIPVLTEKINVSNTNIQNMTSLDESTIFSLGNLYIIGAVVMTMLFLYKIMQLFIKIKNNKIIPKPNYKLVVLTKEESAFSFFDFIFIGKNILKKEHQHILEHELIHVKERHSLDLIFFEIQKIVFWFNPLSYIYQYKISVLHEYIADAKTIKNTNKKSFFENLILQSFQIEKIPFVNNYHNKNLLKNRIMMATKNKSEQILKMKYLVLIPVTLFMLFIASCNNHKTLNEAEELQKTETFIEIKKSPVFPGCENEPDDKAKKHCFASKIQQFITENFDVNLAKDLDLKPGRKKIAIQFVIDTNGQVTDIKCRAPHPELKDEAIKVINQLPKMVPGENINGKKVKVRYNLPIIFNVEGDTDKPKKISDKGMKMPPAPPKPIKPETPKKK